MTENTTTTTDTNISKLDGKGALWTIAGTAIASVATQWLNGNGGILGGNSTAQAANTAVAYEMAKKDAEIAQLKADQATDQKLVQVYTELRAQDKAQDATTADIDKRLSALETAAPLREQIVLGKIGEVSTLASNGIATNSAAIQNLAATVANITKTVVPNTAVCPGWGSVTITPQGSFVYPPTPANPPTPA